MMKFKTNKVLYTTLSDTEFLTTEEREKEKKKERKRNLLAFSYSASIAIPITHEGEE